MDVMNVNEACDYLRVSRTTLWKLRESENLPSFRVSGKVFFYKTLIDEWIKRQKVS